MRVSAGRYKGRVLRCPSQNIRPVMAKMREAIFSLLYSRYGGLEGRNFLDIFCGSAIMSVEAASRGASYIEAVDNDKRKKKILEQNLSILDVPWQLHIADVADYLRQIPQKAFDIIYLDPPFAMPDKVRLLQNLSPNWRQAHGLVLLHLPRHEEKLLPETLHNGLALERCKRYGGSSLSIYTSKF